MNLALYKEISINVMYSLLLAFALYWLLSVLNNLIVSMKEESYIIDKSPSVNK